MSMKLADTRCNATAHSSKEPDPKVAKASLVPRVPPMRFPTAGLPHLARVSRGVVALERLLRVLPEPVAGAVAEDLVVQRLSDEVLAVRPGRHGRHGVHGWIRDVLHLHRDAELPHADGLVVAGGYEAPPLVDEGHAVDGAQVVVVLLRRTNTSSAQNSRQDWGFVPTLM